MKPERFNISNGITLDVVTTTKFKTAQLAVNFLTPLDIATASKNALIPAVLLRGTQNYPTMADISKKLQSLYSASIIPTNYKRGEVQVFGLCADFIDSKYALDDTDIVGGTLDMLSEMLFCPYLTDGAFSSEYVCGEKANLTDKINAKINNKTGYAISRCREEMCSGEAFGISELGTVHSVAEIDEKTLYEYYNSLFDNAQINVFYVGAQPASEIVQKVENMFSHLKERDRKPAELKTEVIRKSESVKEIVEYEPVEQTKLSIGFRTGCVLSDSDYYKFSAFCEIYGGGTTSKLFMNVREKLSLCYYCQAIPESQKGIMIVASGIDGDKYEDAKKEIIAQLDEIKRGNITDEEFDGAIKSLSSEYMSLYDSPDMLESWYINRGLAGRFDSPEDAANILKTVTKDDIVEIAHRLTLDTFYTLKPVSEKGE